MVVLLTGGGLAVLAAFVARTPIPLFLALPLLLAPFVALLSAPAEGPRARIEWGSSGGGATVLVEGRVRVDPTVSGQHLRVGFLPAEPLVLARPAELRRTADVIDVRLELRAPYPCLVWLALPELAWRDPIGLLEVPVEAEGAALRIDRFPPEVSRLRRVHLQRTTQSPGEIRSRVVGRTGEFFAVREAGPGDTARQINWWATARSGRVLANDYQLERTGDLVIVLDLRPSPLGPERDATLLSLSRAAAYGIAQAFLAEKSRVGVAVFAEFVDAVPLGSGRLQLVRIRQLLARARLYDSPGIPERLAVGVGRWFPPGVTTLLISPLADESSTVLLSHLRRRGFPTIVLSPSPLPLLTPPPERSSPDDRLALRLLALVRRRRLAQAWTEAPVVDWDDYWSLATFVRLLSRPSRVRGH